MNLGFLEPTVQTGFKEAQYVIVPLPYDFTASWGTGARFGPERILIASHELELFDEELFIQPYKAGIHTTTPPEIPLPPEKASLVIEEFIGNILSKAKVPISLGGDHSITIGIIRAFKKQYNNFSVIHFDAHGDLRESYQGTPFSHGCVIRRIWKHCQVVQVGIRSISKKEWDFLKKEKVEPIWANVIHEDLSKSINKIISSIKNKDIYLTIDVDCLDPSIMPATGTPEPGGLSWFQITAILKEIVKNFNVIGIDLVELAPIAGINFPEFTVARLIYKLIGYMENKV